MAVTAKQLLDGCQWLTRELTRLEQLNRPLTIDEFYSWAEKNSFIHTIFNKYSNYIVGLYTLNPEHEHCDKLLLDYIEDAFSRHTNVITSGTYGVVDNAYLLAINVLFAISREAEDL